MTHTAQEASLDTCFFSHRLLHPAWRLIKRWGEEAWGGCRGGNTRLPGRSGPCLSRVDFFLTQRLKRFYLKHLFTFQSPKKKKKRNKAAELQAYICPQSRHRHSIRAAHGEHS